MGLNAGRLYDTSYASPQKALPLRIGDRKFSPEVVRDNGAIPAPGSPPHGILVFGNIWFFRILLDPAEKNVNRQRNKRECNKRVE
ncbi:hypothetical protein AGR2A_Cc110004 [Agrobacterium genomosp. 2 str. CFBP 5494]|uniref:Uncharacterized protein n=1 Tax=Agrobacterium genomosp. 2 str. CFBP 5494 TaxID=1183436 RepID=A0A9W5AYM0_9HYPH|nr:hypothetical protein DBL06_11685 [Agrobacterium pusense]CUW86184.1 hypothetical protein AGR2A_Cc110004 [Agrobacterium genomosp. 2 str. CFBP 5494]HCJ73562.1 hypothetical protein [Agrobacterium sp.]